MKNVVKLLSISLLISGVMFTSCKKAVTGVSLSSIELALEVGDNATLEATVAPSDADDKSVTWESSDPSVAIVNNGVVTAKMPGTTSITVKTVAGNFTATCKVTVVLKMEDFYEILASCEHQNGVTWYSSGVQLPVDNPYEGNVNFSAPFRASIKNMSGKIIPAGTPIKCQLMLDDKPYELPGADVPTTILIETTLKKDVEAGAMYEIIRTETYLINPTTHPIGDHTVCLVVSKIGKKDCAPIKGCATYTVKYK